MIFETSKDNILINYIMNSRIIYILDSKQMIEKLKIIYEY